MVGLEGGGVVLQARPDHPSNATTISIISCSWSCRWWARGRYNISHTPAPKSGLLGKYQQMILNVTAGAVWGAVKKRYPPHNLPPSPQQSHAKLSNLHTHTQILYKHNPITTTNSNCCKWSGRRWDIAPFPGLLHFHSPELEVKAFPASPSTSSFPFLTKHAHTPPREQHSQVWLVRLIPQSLFFFYPIILFSKFWPIILIKLPNILFIIPIIPSLNTVHRAPNRFLLYR